MSTVASPGLSKQTLLDLFHDMQVIRQCEEQLAKSHQRGLVHGACHTYVGEEAMAVGAGYSFKLLKSDQVAVAFFGDGAANNGAFHEGLNLASIWDLPVLFVCENNQFATEVPFEYAAGNPRVGNRGESYGMPGFEVDGNDVAAVYEVAGQAVRRARLGEGPTLIECRTYRTRAHAE